MLKLKVNPLIALPYTSTKRVDKLTIQPLSISIRTSSSFYKLVMRIGILKKKNIIFSRYALDYIKSLKYHLSIG